MKPAVIALACLGLGACAIGPDYERPELELPETYRSAQDSGESIANLRWWELFQDPTLQALIEAALTENRDLAVAVARVEEARARFGFVRADQFPQIGVQGGASTTEPGDVLINFGRIDNFQLGAKLDWELDFWGRLRRLTEAQKAELLATEEAQRSVVISLVSDVASTYLLLLDLDQRLDTSRRTLVSREKSLDIIQARFDKGTVPLLDVNQADIQASEAQAAVAALERAIVEAENLLAVLLGRSPEPIIRSRSLFAGLKLPKVPAGLPSELLERRPDVRQAEQSLAAQTARIGAAQALRLPTFNLTGSLGLASQDLSNFTSSDSVTWGIGATLFGPLVDWGKNKRRVEVEKAITRQRLAIYEQTVLQALREVDDSLAGVRTFGDELAARERQLAAASSAAELSRARYDGGVTSFLEVLESERSLFEAELAASSIRRQQFDSVVQLYRALGGGWEPE
jgi:multidrug efflux system outer membrane protein